MKAIILTFIFCLGFIKASNAQQIETAQSPQELFEFHIQKKKTNNLVGWILLGSGAVMITASLIGGDDYVIDSLDPNKKENDVVGWLLIGGGVVSVASIPFFISAGKHKKKAQIQLKNGAVGLNERFNYTGISIALNF